MENRGVLRAWVVRPAGPVLYFRLGAAADFAPLAAALAETKTLLLSPDGALATIPWGLLPDGERPARDEALAAAAPGVDRGPAPRFLLERMPPSPFKVGKAVRLS
ncbi:MAG: hypothetical protein HYZ53_04150 [Planctomycetes bacterium]|nr:hypothetical protein [Planctomycetota bacterium]